MDVVGFAVVAGVELVVLPPVVDVVEPGVVDDVVLLVDDVVLLVELLDVLLELDVVVASAVQVKPPVGTPAAASKCPMRRSARCVSAVNGAVPMSRAFSRTTSTAPYARAPLLSAAGVADV